MNYAMQSYLPSTSPRTSSLLGRSAGLSTRRFAKNATWDAKRPNSFATCAALLNTKTWRRQLRGSNGLFLLSSYECSVSEDSTGQNLGQLSSLSTPPENPQIGTNYGSRVEQANCQRRPKWGKTLSVLRRLAGVVRKGIPLQRDFSLKFSCIVRTGTARTLLLPRTSLGRAEIYSDLHFNRHFFAPVRTS